MPVFEYKAVDEKGKTVTGIIDASSPREARGKLRSQKLYTTRIDEADQKEETTITSEVKVKKLFQFVKQKDISMMTRQLATLLRSGMPLVQSLSAIIEQLEGNPLQQVMYVVRENINSGSSLADAFEEYPKHFSELYVNMIRAGEASGSMDAILQRLANYMESTLKQRNRIRSIMVYPAFMLFIGTGVLVFLMTAIVPTLAKLFAEMNQSLPVATNILINSSAFLSGYGGLALLVVIIGGIIMLKQFIKTEGGRLAFDSFKLRLPILGPLVRKISISRFARTLGTLLAGGTSLVQSLEIVRRVVANETLGQVIDNVKERVIQGDTIADPLRRSKQFPPIVVHMISVGETSGTLEEMLISVSDTYDDEVETMISGLTSVLEPIIIVVMGVIVGFIVMAILLPIFQMNQLSG
jgi:type II secretion system protein F